MKFNSLIIDKLNNFDSVPRQTSKKSSLIQFADIINVCNAECSDSAKNPLPGTTQSTNNVLTNPGNIVQVSAEELKNISSLLAIFENGENVQTDNAKVVSDNNGQNKKELILSGDQLQSFYNSLFSQFNNLPIELGQVENTGQTNNPITVTFDDGTNKVSITISALPSDNTGKDTLQEVTDISRILNSAVVSTDQLKTAVLEQNPLKHVELNSVASAPERDFSNDVNLNNTSAATGKNKASANVSEVKLINNSQSDVSYKIEIVQQIDTTAAVPESPSLHVELRGGNISTNSRPTDFVSSTPSVMPDEKYFAGKNSFDFLTALNTSKPAIDQNTNDFGQQKKNSIEQILFGKDYSSSTSQDDVLQKNVLQSLSNDEKSTLLKSFSNGDIISIDYSQQSTKPLDAVTKTVNPNSVLQNNAVETSQVQSNQQVFKPVAIFNLSNEQNSFGDKTVQEPVLHVNGMVVSEAVTKDQDGKIIAKVSVKQDSQVEDSATFDKEPAVKILPKEEKQASKDLSNAKIDGTDNSKTDQQPIRDAQSNQHDDKDSAKHNASELFKNAIVQNSSSAGTEKPQFVSELRALPDAAKTITKNEIIPEFSKVIQQGEKQTITFQLSPENLGKVKLTVDMVSNNLTARIEVENEQVKQFIQSNIEQLKQNFQSNGIQLNNVNVSLAEYDQRDVKTFVPKKKFSSRYLKEELVEKTASPVSRKSMGYNTYEFLA